MSLATDEEVALGMIRVQYISSHRQLPTALPPLSIRPVAGTGQAGRWEPLLCLAEYDCLHLGHIGLSVFSWFMHTIQALAPQWQLEPTGSLLVRGRT